MAGSLDLVSLTEGLAALPVTYLVAGSAVLLVATLVVLRVLSNTLTFKAPPVMEGIPFVGGLIKFSKGPLALISEGYEKHGEVFTVPVFHKRVTFVLGPHASPHFFNATDDKMSQTEVYDFNVPTFGPGVVYDVDQKVRSEQFRFAAEALRTAKLKTYVPAFVQEAEDYFSKWGETGVVDLMQVFSDLIILTASRTLLGREVREQMFSQVADLFHDLDDGMRPISVFFPYLPTEFHRKRDAARKQLHAIFKKVIEQRRASGVKEDDMLQACAPLLGWYLEGCMLHGKRAAMGSMGSRAGTFVDSKYRNVYGGRALSDVEITGLLIAMLFAGQHTSSVTSTWTGLRMIANKEKTMKPAEDEQRRIMKQHGGEINMDILNQMEVLHLNIQEALRMDPPLIMLMRQCKEPFSVSTSDGRTYVVPKGHIVATSPTFSHRLKHVFAEPNAYQPDRYQPPREEDKALPFSYIGFGGGRHGCMGQNFAYLQVKTIWSVLLRNFEFELVDPFPEPNYDSMVIMPKPCRVRYTRRKL
ncbi:hypothetical protein N2152v2_009130 [Parachlorella kessleri]